MSPGNLAHTTAQFERTLAHNEKTPLPMTPPPGGRMPLRTLLPLWCSAVAQDPRCVRPQAAHSRDDGLNITSYTITA